MNERQKEKKQQASRPSVHAEAWVEARRKCMQKLEERRREATRNTFSFLCLFCLSYCIQVNVKERKRKEAAGHRPNVHAEAWAKAPRKMMQLEERREKESAAPGLPSWSPTEVLPGLDPA